MNETRAAVAQNKASFTTSMSHFLWPGSLDSSSECHFLASLMRSDSSLLREAFEQYSALHDQQGEKDGRILLNARFLALCDMYRMLGKGVFFKSDALNYAKVDLKKEFERLKQMHAIAPEYVPKPLELVKNSSGATVSYAMELGEGESLEKCLISKKPLPEWVEDQIIDFINKIHSKGFTHSDFCDCNILIGRKISVVDPDEEMLLDTLWEEKLREKEVAYLLIRDIKIYRERPDAFPKGTTMISYARDPMGWAAYAKAKGIDKWHEDWKAYTAEKKKRISG